MKATYRKFSYQGAQRTRFGFYGPASDPANVSRHEFDTRRERDEVFKQAKATLSIAEASNQLLRDARLAPVKVYHLENPNLPFMLSTVQEAGLTWFAAYHLDAPKPRPGKHRLLSLEVRHSWLPNLVRV